MKTNITGVYGECFQCLGHSGFEPTHSVCAFLVYTAQAAGWGNFLKWALKLSKVPRSEPLRFRFLGTPQKRRLSWACSVLCPSQV